MKIRIAEHVQDFQIPGYLSRNKAYEAFEYLGLPNVRTITDDDGDEIVIGLVDCAHLGGAFVGWEVVEEADNLG